jgi:hypothetical protein
MDHGRGIHKEAVGQGGVSGFGCAATYRTGMPDGVAVD